MKPCQHGGISAICFDPVASTDRDERRSDDLAFKSKAHQLAVKAVAAWTCLVDEAQASAARRQSLCKLRDNVWSVREDAKVAHFTATFAISNCRRNCRRMDI